MTHCTHAGDATERKWRGEWTEMAEAVGTVAGTDAENGTDELDPTWT